MFNRSVYGICGFKGSGKNTVASAILQRHHACRAHSFAAVLKDGVSAIFGWSRELLEGDSVTSREWREREDLYWSAAFGRTITPRIVLQEVGTNLFRNWLQDFWVRAAAKRAESNGIHIFTDARFRNEMNWIRQTDGVLLWVYRHDTSELNTHDRASLASVIRKALPLADENITLTTKLHPSETSFLTEGADLIDIVIENNGSYDDLKRIAEHIDQLWTNGDLVIQMPFRRTTLYVSLQFEQFVWRWRDKKQDCHERTYDIMTLNAFPETSEHNAPI